MKKLLYPGTFDPITNGHIDILRRLIIQDNDVYIYLCIYKNKNTFFSLKNRYEFAKKSLKKIKNIEIITYEGATIDLIKKYNINYIVRGIRNIFDMQHEMNLFYNNKRLYEKVDSLYLFPNKEYIHVSSSTVRELIRLKKDISFYVPESVINFLKKGKNYVENN